MQQLRFDVQTCCTKTPKLNILLQKNKTKMQQLHFDVCHCCATRSATDWANPTWSLSKNEGTSVQETPLETFLEIRKERMVYQNVVFS